MNTVLERMRRHAPCLWLVAACLIPLAAPVFAEGETPAPAQPQAESGAPPAPAPAAEEKAAPDTINLNLKGANIEQVMKFIGDTTGKPVLQGKDVKGTVTVVSPGAVTKERGIDLICQALRIQGISVVERDGVIYVVQTKDVPQLGVQPVEPAGAEPAEGFVRKMIPIQFADVEHVQKLVEPLLGEGAKAQADPVSRQLILTVSAADLPSIERVISQVDVLEIQETQVRIFQLKHAEAAEIADVLKAVLEGGTGAAEGGGARKPPREGAPPGGPSSSAGVLAVVAYPTVNWILVRAPKETLEAAEALIAELDREKPPEVTLFVLTLKHSDARDLARQLSEVFKQRRVTRGVRDTVEITADTRSNSLIVYATPENAELVKGVVKEVDTEESRRTETRIRPLEHADADDLATQLNGLYSASIQYSYPWYSYSRQQLGETTRFVAEPHSNSLIIVAQPNQFEEIEELITKLDQPLNTTEISPRIYPVRNVDAEDMTDVLNEVFGGQQEQRSSGYWYYYDYSRTQQSTVGRLYGKTRFVHEPATNSVIVITNNAKNFDIIEEVIRDLDRAMPEAANTMVYPLEHADAEVMATQLNRLFAPPGTGKTEDKEGEAVAAFYSWLMGTSQEEERPISNLIGKVRVVGDPRTNSLMITTAVQNFEALRSIIGLLDAASPKVLIRVQLVEVMRTDEKRIGTRWTSDSTIFDTKDFNNGLVAAFGYTWQQVSGNSTVNASVNISALVQFLQREFDARVLSQPTLVVSNNEEARLFVGTEIPFISKSTTEPGTIARSDSFEYKDVGLKLNIKPHINREGQVVTSVVLESSQIREGETLFGAALVDTRQYETHLAVDSGQTIVIGGILTTEQSEIVHRVPILGHIPILSLLFSKRDKVLNTRELIAFITPTVLRTRAEDDAATGGERASMPEAGQMLEDNNAPE
jgi:general secretion pathway protein D